MKRSRKAVITSLVCLGSRNEGEEGMMAARIFETLRKGGQIRLLYLESKHLIDCLNYEFPSVYLHKCNKYLCFFELAPGSSLRDLSAVEKRDASYVIERERKK